ncbi:MAG: hypothetical protein RLZZ618_2846 [Pseudomonadota bacterium]|jgi:uncharacterized protein YbaP (TraB family)
MARLQRDARDGGFLWKVTRGGHSSYLYGTMHVGRQAWLTPGPTVRAALMASDTVALELDLEDPDIAQRIQRGSRARPDRRLPAALQARLVHQMAAECLPSDLLEALSPEMVGAALTVTAARREGLHPEYGVDGVVAAYGRQLGKPIVSLETAEAQLALLISSSNKALRESVESMLNELEHHRTTPVLLRIARLWETGDEAELERYPQWCDCARTTSERAELKKLLGDRNPVMADRIAKLHGRGSRVFAAVGSLHLAEPHGLPSLMRARGFVVERVAFDRPGR